MAGSRLIICFSLLLSLATSVSFSEASESPTGDGCLGDVCDGNLLVRIPNGVLKGRDNRFYYSYEGIPYAQPPVEELRFANPKRFTGKWNGIFDATKPPKRCLQYEHLRPEGEKLQGFEDCLSVNIYRPKYVDESLPVLVYIHGGAFMFGGPNDYEETLFMRSGRVIIVKITYRVGPLGFLSTGDDVLSGNYGLKDQRMAFEWIKENIKHFGGDPERMMLMGFSAGGSSVHLQLLKPNLQKIFKVAAAFSGNAFNPFTIVRTGPANAFRLGELLGCGLLESSSKLKKCLQFKSAEEIVGAVKHFLVMGYNPFTVFGPVIESSSVKGAFISKPPEEIIASGKFAKIPWLISYTKDDGTYNAAELMKKDSNGKELIYLLNDQWMEFAPFWLFYYHLPKEAKDAFSLYLKEKYLKDEDFSPETFKSILQMFTDRVYKDPVEQAVKLHTKHSNSPLYVYRFNIPAENGGAKLLSERDDIDFGTGHGDDLISFFPYDFNPASERPADPPHSQKFIRMLEDFVYTNELTFGTCEFVDTAGKEQIHLMLIEKDSCNTVAVDSLP